MTHHRAKLLVPALGLGLAAAAACAPPQTLAGFSSTSRNGGTGFCATRNSVSVQDIHDAQATRIEELLERIPGVEVSLVRDGYSVQIRGTNGFAGNGEPLYVIDGMPYNGVRGQAIPVTPQDVECVEILKDVGYTSLFGTRGANGVVLITTRRAR